MTKKKVFFLKIIWYTRKIDIEEVFDYIASFFRLFNKFFSGGI